MGTARMARPTYEQLEARVRQLEAQNARLAARIAQIERLLDKATRDGKEIPAGSKASGDSAQAAT